MKKSSHSKAIIATCALLLALSGCAPAGNSSSARTPSGSSAVIVSSEAVQSSGQSLGGAEVTKEQLEAGGVWYVLKQTEAITADTPVEAVLYFSRGGLLCFRMAELDGRHILSDFVTRDDAQIVEALRREREQAFTAYAGRVAARLSREQEALRSQAEGHEVNRSAVLLSGKTDSQLLWQLTETLALFAPSDESFLEFLNGYFSGDISQAITQQIVIEQAEAEWKKTLEGAIASDEKLLEYLQSSLLTAGYDAAQSENGTLVTFAEKCFNKEAALAERNDLLLPEGEGSADIERLIRYLGENQDYLELVSFNEQEIVLRLKEGAQPAEQTGAALTEQTGRFRLAAAWEAPAEARQARTRTFTGYTGDGELIITADDAAR